MNAWRRRLRKAINGQIILVILGSLIFVHLMLMFVYLRDNRIARESAKRDRINQKIINAIYLVEATPVANRKHAVDAMEDPAIHVSLTATPQWAKRFKRISFWDVSHALNQGVDDVALSIRLEPKQWLNINATVVSHFIWEQLLIFALEIIVFGAVLFAVWSFHRFTKPLQKFKKAADRLGIDLHSKPIDVYGPSVVREAAAAMNQMQERIQDLIRDRTQMLAAISHDLRTPITRMKLRCQFLEEAYLQENLIHDLDEMEQMIAETLAFAREDANVEKKAPIDLVSLLESICEDMVDMGHEVTFHTNCHRLKINASPLALKRAFTNIINNANRYAHHVRVEIFCRFKKIFVRIEDDGPGISEDDLKRVFDPFYRGEHSRSRDTGGVGLGLAVTRDIVKAHGGQIVLKNLEPHGLRVSVTLDLT